MNLDSKFRDQFNEKYGLQSSSQYKTKALLNQYTHSDFVKSLLNPNTLIKVTSWCRGTTNIDFYAPQEGFFIKLQVSMKQQFSSGKHASPNPICNK